MPQSLELRDTRDRLQSMIEEHETALEELKSSNEELQTVNAELHSKLDSLDRANSDLENLFESSQVATVFFGRRPGDPQLHSSGGPRVQYPSRPRPPAHRPLQPDPASGVGPRCPPRFRYLETVERRIELEDDQPSFLMRLLPYRNGTGATEGVVATFLDMTNITQVQAQQKLLIDAESQADEYAEPGLRARCGQRPLGLSIASPRQGDLLGINLAAGSVRPHLEMGATGAQADRGV